MSHSFKENSIRQISDWRYVAGLAIDQLIMKLQSPAPTAKFLHLPGAAELAGWAVCRQGCQKCTWKPHCQVCCLRSGVKRSNVRKFRALKGREKDVRVRSRGLVLDVMTFAHNHAFQQKMWSFKL